MSIAFIPITAKSNLYNEEVVTNKWNSFLTNLSKSIENVSNIKINQNEFNSIIENTLLKHYSIPSSSSSTPIKNTSVKVVKQKQLSKNENEENENEENEEEEEKIKETKVKKEVKKEEKIKETKVKKVIKKEVKKEERPRCNQILKNNEQCKGKSVKNSEFCTRHTPKEEKEVEDSD